MYWLEFKSCEHNTKNTHAITLKLSTIIIYLLLSTYFEFHLRAKLHDCRIFLSRDIAADNLTVTFIRKMMMKIEQKKLEANSNSVSKAPVVVSRSVIRIFPIV